MYCLCTVHSVLSHCLLSVGPSPLPSPQCYRLYTRTYFEKKMPDTTTPEMCRTSLSGAVLQLKALGLPGLDVLSFGFLDPPEQVRGGGEGERAPTATAGVGG